MSTQQQTAAPDKRNIVRRIADKVTGKRPPAIESTWNRLHKEGAFIPISNQTDTETRRTELREAFAILAEKMGKNDDQSKREIVDAAYGVFFTVGSPWYRGLGNRELAKKVAKYLQLYNSRRKSPAYLGDLHMCSMQLINLSWQTLDVTNTPWIIIESRPFATPPDMGSKRPESDADDSGLRQYNRFMQQQHEKAQREAEREE